MGVGGRGRIVWKERAGRDKLEGEGKEGNGLARGRQHRGGELCERNAEERRGGEKERRREGKEERSGAAGSQASAEDINNLCSIKQSCVAK